MDQIRFALQQFIIDEFLSPLGRTTLDANYPLFEEGVIDSLGLIILTNHIEETYGVKFQSEEIVLENFETVDVITAVIAQKITERDQV